MHGSVSAQVRVIGFQNKHLKHVYTKVCLFFFFVVERNLHNLSFKCLKYFSNEILNSDNDNGKYWMQLVIYILRSDL